MNGKIVVVGGYGNVGRIIALELDNRFPGKVIVAGKSITKALTFSKLTEMRIKPLKMNIFNPEAVAKLPDDTCLVIMCLDIPAIGFVKQCLQRGIHYIDISANYERLAQIESLNNEAKEHGATAILSVGVAPGLTNLLTAHCKSKLEQIISADIFILLGLGETHGEAAIRWAIENLNSEFSVMENGTPKKVRSFKDAKQAVFPQPIGKRKAYRFNFSDQHVLSKTLQIPSVSTRLSFDSSIVTFLLALGEKIGLLQLLRFRIVRELLVWVFKKLHFGSDLFAVKVQGYGVNNHKDVGIECSAIGRSEADYTALIASEVATTLFTAGFASGVFHIEEIFSPEDMIAKLQEKGLHVDH